MSVNIKLIAVAVVVVLLVAAAGILFLDNRKRVEEIDFISGLESVGSGIFYRESVISSPDVLFTIREPGDVTYHPDNWNKLIFGTPSVVSIQQIQLKTIVEMYLNDPSKSDHPKSFKLVPYVDGQTLEDGKVYYIILGGSQMMEDKKIDAGITGLPRLLKLVQDDMPFSLGALTNDLFPHQTCCAVSVNKSFADAHPDVVVRVVWAIKQSTDWLNKALEKGKTNPNDPDYLKALQVGARVAGPIYTEEEIAEAIVNVEYAWGDNNPSDPLRTLKADIAYITDDLEKINAVTNKVSDLGFKNTTEYAEKQVDDQFLKEALKGKPSYDDDYTVRFALIGGDIHQLPVHLAYTLLPGQTQTFYEQVGINFQYNSVSIGNVVVAALKANEADFGVTGQPPIIVDAINNELIRA
ncbi:MAG: hypothetical protein LBV63_04380 [Candidatus Methanoplasma sp.]|jgi:hypothetical protein|nr:hypothetical protein [Candidatus Methanoplasma sp.]